MVQDNFIVHETKEAHKAIYIRHWIGDQGTQHLMKYEWKIQRENHERVLERLRAKFSERVEIKETNTDQR